MKRLISLFLAALLAVLLPLQAPAGTPQNNVYAIGPLSGLSTGSLENNSNTNNTTNRVAYTFIPTVSKTVSKVIVRVVSVTGTLAPGDLRLDIMTSDTTAGKPTSTSLANSSTLTAVPTGASFIEFTGFNQAVTAHTKYHLVIRNQNASAGTNFATLLVGAADSGLIENGSTGGTWGWNYNISTNSGTSYSTLDNSLTSFRVEYTDGTFEGFPYFGAGNDTTNIVYSGREVGFKLTTPSNAKWRIKGLLFPVFKSGTPTGDVRFRLYNDTTLLATSAATFPIGAVGTSASVVYAYLPFSSIQEIEPGTTIRGVIGETTQSDASTNYIATRVYNWHNDANSLALKPLGASLTYYNGTSWTDTSTILPMFKIVLDEDQPFASTGAGSGGRIFF